VTIGPGIPATRVAGEVSVVDISDSLSLLVVEDLKGVPLRDMAGGGRDNEIHHLTLTLTVNLE
jgi:hypothetical protein